MALEMPDDTAIERFFPDEVEDKPRLAGFPLYQAVVSIKHIPATYTPTRSNAWTKHHGFRYLKR